MPAAPRPTDAKQELAADLRVALTCAVRRLRQERSSDLITDGQYAVLAALGSRGPMTPSALAEDARVRPPHMSRTLNALVAAGLAARTEHPTDGRVVVVTITQAGRDEVQETRRRRNEWLARRLARFAPEERRVLARAVDLLTRLAEA